MNIFILEYEMDNKYNISSFQAQTVKTNKV